MKPELEGEVRNTALTVALGPKLCENADGSPPDANPFDLTYDTYAPLLRKIACAKFGISTDDAGDLVHDVFATYLVNPARVGDLRPYLIGAICNASRSYLRRMSAQDANCSNLDTCIAADEDVLEAVGRDMLIGRILGRLGSSCRDALHRFYIQGDTAAAIAERRNTSASYIGRLLHFCRKRARDAYHAMERNP
jgi:RNA polymerase sigma factor (sigma-70 family)